jgi:hypothetical protein
MTFSVFIYAAGGYAVVLLAGMLVLETARGPVPQRPRMRQPSRLQPWPRLRRDCPAGHERALPLRAARQATPAGRRRSAPRSCPR